MLDQTAKGQTPLRYLVADRFEASRRPAARARYDRPNFCSLQVCDQLRTSLRPDSVMEFGMRIWQRRREPISVLEYLATP